MARRILVSAFLALAAAPASVHAEANVTFLHHFNGTDEGCEPRSGVSFDHAGNLYGTAFACGVLDKGVIYKLAPDGTFSVLSDFPKDGDGRRPEAELVVSGSGKAWGATLAGGGVDQGTVFEMSPTGHLKTLYSFTGGSDGSNPVGVLVRDAARNLYGATNQDGAGHSGVIFKVAADGSFSVVHTFTELSQGVDPNSGLAADAQGNLYGTAQGGSNRDGVVYKLTPDGIYSVLYSFGADSSDGQFPVSTPVLDSQGNLYGTAFSGGNGVGTIYKIAPDGTETTLYAFKGPALGDGSRPNGITLIGNKLYGTTEDTAVDNLGTIFRYDLSNGRYRQIYTFRKQEGYLPIGLLAKGPDGAIYGTTSTDGQAPGAGTIFKLED